MTDDQARRAAIVPVGEEHQQVGAAIAEFEAGLNPSQTTHGGSLI